MGKHDHNTCEHELNYCRVCDVVYCELCGDEWVKNKWALWSTYSYPPQTTSYTLETQHEHGE